MSYELEKLFRVYDTKSAEVGVYIEVKPSPDYPEEFVEICTGRGASAEYYGDLSLTLPKEQAKLLAKAILELTGD